MNLDQSKTVLKTCLESWTSDRIYVAFNGGKDATVVLELYSELLNQHGRGGAGGDCCSSKIHAVWFKEDEFAEVETFVDQTVKNKQLDLQIYNGSYKVMLREFLRDVCSTKNDTVVIIMGYRHTDGRAGARKFNEFAPISANLCYPGFPGIRCNPILNWSYGDVWDFIVKRNLAVCPLYYKGYSSLGPRDKSFINPALAGGRVHPQNLTRWSSEREARTPDPHLQTPDHSNPIN